MSYPCEGAAGSVEGDPRASIWTRCRSAGTPDLLSGYEGWQPSAFYYVPVRPDNRVPAIGSRGAEVQ